MKNVYLIFNALRILNIILASYIHFPVAICIRIKQLL